MCWMPGTRFSDDYDNLDDYDNMPNDPNDYESDSNGDYEELVEMFGDEEKIPYTDSDDFD